jgi:hypothetical protein
LTVSVLAVWLVESYLNGPALTPGVVSSDVLKASAVALTCFGKSGPNSDFQSENLLVKVTTTFVASALRDVGVARARGDLVGRVGALQRLELGVEVLVGDQATVVPGGLRVQRVRHHLRVGRRQLDVAEVVLVDLGRARGVRQERQRHHRVDDVVGVRQRAVELVVVEVGGDLVHGPPEVAALLQGADVLGVDVVLAVLLRGRGRAATAVVAATAAARAGEQREDGQGCGQPPRASVQAHSRSSWNYRGRHPGRCRGGGNTTTP